MEPCGDARLTASTLEEGDRDREPLVASGDHQGDSSTDIDEDQSSESTHSLPFGGLEFGEMGEAVLSDEAGEVAEAGEAQQRTQEEAAASTQVQLTTHESTSELPEPQLQRQQGGEASSEALPVACSSPEPDETLLAAAVSNLSFLHQQGGMRSSGSAMGEASPSSSSLSSNSENNNGENSAADNSLQLHSKHFFILSSSGKPIYSYHGDENSLAGLMALIAAVISVVEDQGDKLHHVVSGVTTIVFLVRGPLYLVATSSRAEPVVAMQQQLDLLYNQVVLIVTKGGWPRRAGGIGQAGMW